MTMVVFALLALGGGALALRPFLRHVRWPDEMPDERDDVARAVSSLRDLEFALAAGTIALEDHARLRAALEREALLPRGAPATVRVGAGDARYAPVRTLVVAALLAGTAAVVIAVSLPREVGDRAPGMTITGTVPLVRPSIEQLEAEAKSAPRDVPTLLALADAYVGAGRQTEAATAYRRVLTIDPENVPALNGIALILVFADQRDAGEVAVNRVLQLRPRDPDALFLKGLIAYKQERWQVAVDTWRTFLEVGETHPGAEMVRPLYEIARGKVANR